MANRQRSFGLDHVREIEAVNVLHRKDDGVAKPGGVVGRDDIGMAETGDGPDFAQEPVEHAGAFHDVPAHHLEHLVAPHEAGCAQGRPRPFRHDPRAASDQIGRDRRRAQLRFRTRLVEARRPLLSTLTSASAKMARSWWSKWSMRYPGVVKREATKELA